MSYKNQQCGSRLVTDSNNPPNQITLRRLDKESLNFVFRAYENMCDWRNRNFLMKYKKFIIMVKNDHLEFDEVAIQELKRLVRQLILRLQADHPRVLGAGTKHIRIIKDNYALFDNLIPSILKSKCTEYEHRKKKITKRLTQYHKVYQLLIEDTKSVKQISQRTGVPQWRIYRMIINPDERFDGIKQSFHTLAAHSNVLLSLSDVLKEHNYAFSDGSVLYDQVVNENPALNLSKSAFYQHLKTIGLTNKKSIYRSTDTPILKESRISFFANYVKYLNNRRYDIVYFDWTSYSESNFKQNSWSLQGRKSIIHERYGYSALHFLAMISLEKVEAFQFIRGTLTSSIVFNFLSGALSRPEFIDSHRGRQLVIVLDNAPSNCSNALIALCVERRITLLFTAPNSSFLNPIEMLFAFLKSNLKKIHSINKFGYQQTNYSNDLSDDQESFKPTTWSMDSPDIKISKLGLRAKRLDLTQRHSCLSFKICSFV